MSRTLFVTVLALPHKPTPRRGRSPTTARVDITTIIVSTLWAGGLNEGARCVAVAHCSRLK